jgi:hypothetical protein
MTRAATRSGRTAREATALAFAAALLIPLAGAEARDEILLRDLTPEQRPMAELETPRGDLDVRIWTGRRDATYRPGDHVTLFVEASKDAYITILDVGTSGRTHVIFPNKMQRDNRVRAGEVVAIPDEDARWRLRVGGPPGRELVKVFASEQPFSLYKDDDVEESGPFRTYRRQGEALTRELSLELKRPRKAAVVTATTMFRILPGKAGGRPESRPDRPQAGRGETESPDELFQKAEAHWYGELTDGIPDPRKALRWYKAAAEAGHVQAMLRIGRILEDGQEVDQDLRGARRWYEQAAERGNTQAMVRIARMHALGVGTKKNVEAAVAWLGKAVDQGDGIAMQTLAKIYDEGAGVRKDPAASADLVIRALKAGAWTTLDLAAKLSLEARMALQEQLTAAKLYNGPIDGVIGPATRKALGEIGRTP